MTLLMFALSGIRNPFAPFPGFGTLQVKQQGDDAADVRPFSSGLWVSRAMMLLMFAPPPCFSGLGSPKKGRISASASSPQRFTWRGSPKPEEGANISSIIALLLHPKPEEGANISCIVARALRLEGLQSPEKGSGGALCYVSLARYVHVGAQQYPFESKA